MDDEQRGLEFLLQESARGDESPHVLARVLVSTAESSGQRINDDQVHLDLYRIRQFLDGVHQA